MDQLLNFVFAKQSQEMRLDLQNFFDRLAGSREWRMKLRGFVSELFIVNSARGRGLGTLLLKAIEAEAIELGCSRLQLINFRNRKSYYRSFYEKAGWIERPEGASFVRYIDE